LTAVDTPPKLAFMARYSALLGCKVEVQYRAGDLLLPATGTLAADSGRSIFLEQKFEQHGMKTFRWEIPYQCIVRLESGKIAPLTAAVGASSSQSPSAIVEEVSTVSRNGNK